jgi:hypothetical protein
MSKADWGFWIGAAGTLAGVLGLAASVIQARRARRLNDLRQRWLANVMSDSARLIDQSDAVVAVAQGATAGNARTDLEHLATATRGRLLTQYEGMVAQFLDGEHNVSSSRMADIQRDLATGHWQGEVWRRARASIPASRPRREVRSATVSRDQLRMPTIADSDKTPKR